MSVDPLTLSAIGMAGNQFNNGVNFLGSLWQNWRTREANERMNERNIALAREQMNWNESMWNKQNAYNHPIQQMQRLKGAGLNPHLIYGTGTQGAVGNAGDVKGYDRADVKSTHEGVRAFSDYMNFRGIQAQINNADAIAEAKKQEAIKTATESAILGKRLGKEDEFLNANLEGLTLRNQKTDLENKNLEVQFEIANKTKQQKIKRASAELEGIIRANKGKTLENKIREFETNLNKRGLTKSDDKLLRWYFTNYGDKDLIGKLIESINPFNHLPIPILR